MFVGVVASSNSVLLDRCSNYLAQSSYWKCACTTFITYIKHPFRYYLLRVQRSRCRVSTDQISLTASWEQLQLFSDSNSNQCTKGRDITFFQVSPSHVKPAKRAKRNICGYISSMQYEITKLLIRSWQNRDLSLSCFVFFFLIIKLFLVL